MITIAVAGGTAPGLGRAVVTAIQQYPDQLKVIVLSRQASTVPEWLEKSGVEVRKVDYNSQDSLYQALQGVHTILCTLLATDGTWARTQKNLLDAGLRAGISRFAPAEFGVGPRAASQIDILQPTRDILSACREAKLHHSGFEFACFHSGLFMNYLGYGAPDEKAALHEMRDTWVFAWDVKNMRAGIPLRKDGEVPHMSMMEISDVGRFAAAACLLPKGRWQEDFSMVGETLSMDEVVKIIEEVRRVKMEVTYREYEKIKIEEEKEDIGYPNKFWLQMELQVGQDKVGGVVLEPILNGLCPEVKPMSVEQYMKKFWSQEWKVEIDLKFESLLSRQHTRYQ